MDLNTSYIRKYSNTIGLKPYLYVEKFKYPELAPLAQWNHSQMKLRSSIIGAKPAQGKKVLNQLGGFTVGIFLAFSAAQSFPGLV
jgi:hypothetical protein